ncbi:MAG: hypothetical protein ACYC7E_09020 [Armatimonadota bacterium]
MNLEFFERLYADPEFCAALGKMTLAAGRFESNLRAYLIYCGVKVPEREATLGALILKLEKSQQLSQNGLEVLNTLKCQRNYLTHSLYDLFTERTEEKILPRTDLIPLDIYAYITYVGQLEENLCGLSATVEERIARIIEGTVPPLAAGKMLFRP